MTLLCASDFKLLGTPYSLQTAIFISVNRLQGTSLFGLYNADN